MSITTHSPIVVAMDFDTPEQCLAVASQLKPEQCRLKIGKELFTVAGPQLVERLMHQGFDVFLDLKYHDIPNTVAKSVKAASNLGVWMVNVHASGGRRMLEAAKNAIEIVANPPLLIAVTVLTSMSKDDLMSIGLHVTPEEQVMRLASLAKEVGLDGVVCSAMEAQILKRALGREFYLVTPGIRPADSVSDDQRRIMTPEQAIQNGSDYLVIGRPITQSSSPSVACNTILQSLAAI